MAIFSVSGISVKGISCCLPKKIEYNADLDILSKDEIAKFIESTGISERRVVSDLVCASDLCLSAAEDLIAKLQWNKSEIEILIFVSQTGDYLLPVTSTILQDRLGLSKTCIAFDVPLGCSGYVYGLSIIASMMKASGLKKGLLLAGDALSKKVSRGDKSTRPLFGDAGTATALEGVGMDVMHFDLGSDGSGYRSIIIPDGGARNGVHSQSLLEVETDDTIRRSRLQLKMDGMDVFSFGISEVPKTVNRLLEYYNLSKENIDLFIFHQANMMMNKMIAKKLKLPSHKVPYTLEKYGNTSSATIPLTIISALKNQIDVTKSLLLCGFGVGLSWGTATMCLDKQVILNLFDYHEQSI